MTLPSFLAELVMILKPSNMVIVSLQNSVGHEQSYLIWEMNIQVHRPFWYSPGQNGFDHIVKENQKIGTGYSHWFNFGSTGNQ